MSQSLAEKLPEGLYRHLVVTLPKKMGLRSRQKLELNTLHRLHKHLGHLILEQHIVSTCLQVSN